MKQRIHFQKHPGQNGESHHLEPWEFEPQLCQYPKTQHWFDDLKLWRNTSFSYPTTLVYDYAISKQHQNIQENHVVQKHGPTEWNFIIAVLKYQPMKPLNPYLLIHWQHMAVCCFCAGWCEQSSRCLVEWEPWTQQAKWYFLPDDSPFSEYTDISGRAHAWEKGKYLYWQATEALFSHVNKSINYCYRRDWSLTRK